MNLFKGSVTKQNLITKTEERDFEKEKKKIQHLEEATKKIFKNSKEVVSAVNAHGKTCGKIGHDLIYGFDDASQTLKDFEQTMNKQGMLAVDKTNMVQHSLVGPMKEFSIVFPECFDHIKARNKALEEYAKAQSKLEKCQEKENTAANSVRLTTLKREVQPVKQDFQEKNAILMKELPELYQSRLDYVQPCLEAFLSTQCWYYNECLKSLEMCANNLSIDVDEDGDSNINRILDDIKLLSITSDD